MPDRGRGLNSTSTFMFLIIKRGAILKTAKNSNKCKSVPNQGKIRCHLKLDGNMLSGKRSPMRRDLLIVGIVNKRKFHVSNGIIFFKDG